MTKTLKVAPFILLGILSLYPAFRGPSSLSLGDEGHEPQTGLAAASRDVVILVIDFSSRPGSAVDKHNLEMMRDLDRMLFDSDWVRSYSGPLNATVVKTDGDDILVVPFIPKAIVDRYDDEAVRKLVEEYPKYAELVPYISADFLSVAFYLEPGINVSAQSLVRELDIIQRRLLADHGITFEYTGVRPIRALIERYMTQDAARIIPLLFVLVSLVYLVAFGSPRILGLSWLIKILVTTASYACYRIFFDGVSPLLILIPTFNFGLLSDYLIHVFYHSTGTLGSVDAASIRRYLAVPLSLTAATSLIGFASLSIFADTGHVMLSVVVGTSIVLTYVLALWWVPTWGSRIRPSRRIQSVLPLRSIQRALTRLMTIVLMFVWKRRVVVLTGSGILLVLAAIQLPKLEVQPYPVKQLPETSTVVAAEELLGRKFSGTIPFTVEIDAGSTGSFLHSDGLEALERIHKAFSDNDEVGFHRSMLSVIKQMHYYFNGSDPEYLAIPAGLDAKLFVQLIEQYLLFYSASASPEEYESIIDTDYSIATVHGILNYRDGDSLSRLVETVKAAEAVAPSEWRFNIGGVAAALVERKRSLESNWYISLVIGSVLIFLTVLVLYRNAFMALIGLIPSLAILVWTAGLSSLFRIAIDEYTIIIVAISIGLTIDYTIHMLNAIRKSAEKRRDILSYAYSVIRRSGIPILLSLLTTVLAFSTMYLSSFSGAAHFSTLLSLSIVAAFCIGVFVLPVFFAKAVKEDHI